MHLAMATGMAIGLVMGMSMAIGMAIGLATAVAMATGITARTRETSAMGVCLVVGGLPGSWGSV